MLCWTSHDKYYTKCKNRHLNKGKDNKLIKLMKRYQTNVAPLETFSTHVNSVIKVLASKSPHSCPFFFFYIQGDTSSDRTGRSAKGWRGFRSWVASMNIPLRTRELKARSIPILVLVIEDKQMMFGISNQGF